MKFTVSIPTAVNPNTPSTSQYLKVLFIATTAVPVGPSVTSKPDSKSKRIVLIFA